MSKLDAEGRRAKAKYLASRMGDFEWENGLEERTKLYAFSMSGAGNGQPRRLHRVDPQSPWRAICRDIDLDVDTMTTTAPNADTFCGNCRIRLAAPM